MSRTIYEYEILEAIANAGHTYSPEAVEGKYIMRNCDLRDLVSTLADFLVMHGVAVSDLTRVERYMKEKGTFHA